MSNSRPLAERVLERAMKHGLTPEATQFLEMRNQILFGTGKVRDLSKEDEPGLYGRRQAFHRLMLELFTPDDGMPLKKERISRPERAKRWHKRVDDPTVPPTAHWMVGVRKRDQFVVKFLMEKFSEAVEGIVDHGDVTIFSSPETRSSESIPLYGTDAIWERLKEELETELKLNSGDPTTHGYGPIVDVYVRAGDKKRKVAIGLSQQIYTLKEVLIEKIKAFCEENELAQQINEGKVYLTIHWGDEEEGIEVEFPLEDSV